MIYSSRTLQQWVLPKMNFYILFSSILLPWLRSLQYLAHWTTTKSPNLKSRSERADRQIAIRIHGGGVPRARPMTAHSNDLMTLFICTSTSHCPSPLREHNTRCKRRRRGPWTPRTKGQTRWCRTENSEQVFVLVCWESTKHTLKENDSLSIKGRVMYHPVA